MKTLQIFVQTYLFFWTSQIRKIFAGTWLSSLIYHFATYYQFFYTYFFTKKFRMISNKDVVYDGLITFWKKPSYPRFIPSIQPFLIIYSWLLKLFISKWGSFENHLLQSGASTFSKWDTRSYFKVGHCLFQSWVKVISKLYYTAKF